MSHKAQQIILHFGLAKTGTTAIQRVLFEQQEYLLRTQGILYPGREENHFHLQSLFAEKPESLIQIQRLGLPDEAAIAAFLADYRHSMLREIAETKPQKIIISSEYFSGMSIAELAEMRAFLATLAAEIRLFAYVRDPWSFAVSLTQEMIRAGSLDRPIKFGYMQSNIEIFDKFEDAFGAGMTIAPYAEGERRMDVVADFCERIGIALNPDSRNRKEIKQPVNTRMSREAACVMLRLNQMYPRFDNEGRLIDDGSRDWMIEALQQVPLRTSPISVSKKTAKTIYDRAKSDIALMEENYFSGDNVFTRLYQSMELDDFDDELSVSTLSQERLVAFMLAAMRVLSDRAIYYHRQMTKSSMERVLWEGKYFAQIGQGDAARRCFEDVLKTDPLHDEARKQLDGLDVAGKANT